MSILNSFLTTINFLGLIYLVFIVYKKNSVKPKVPLDFDKTHIQEVLNKSIQKITLTRFNPFEDLGGNQSFILCLLDNNSSGVIITSLHNRDNTRIYAKTIINGQTQGISLSKEEKSAILKTIKS